MALPSFTMRALLEAGVHYGHDPRRWNPKMSTYLYGVRNNVHIINLEHTVPMLYRGMKAIQEVVKQGGRVLFVGTKMQASPIIAEYAQQCGQYYVNHRWLGGMLTNWKTVSRSIRRLKDYNEQLNQETTGFTKKETLQMTRERDKLERSIGGIKEMGGLPNILFIIDVKKEETAIKEANKLNIPVVAVVDSNTNPENITYPIPGNDDAIRAIRLYCELMAGSALDGVQQQLKDAGVDLGENVNAGENLPAETAGKATAKQASTEKGPTKAKGAEKAAATAASLSETTLKGDSDKVTAKEEDPTEAEKNVTKAVKVKQTKTATAKAKTGKVSEKEAKKTPSKTAAKSKTSDDTVAEA